MPDFRLYFLGRGGRIVEARDLECEDDEAAILAVEGQRDGRAMELWRRDRRVRSFPTCEG
ncbi:MAG: hypothetical protein JO111_08415 [Caulobacteraceae bacterium]|nr:hypothetical protein [Caulobacteraceae bacterium]